MPSISQASLNPLRHPTSETITGGAPFLDRPPENSAATSDWSPSLQDLLDQPTSQLPLWFALGGIAFSSAFAAWAYLGKIQEVSHAPGKLVPQGEVYKIQPIVAGKVDRILIQEGQTVEAGQPLVTLDNSLAIAEVERFQQDLFSNQLQLHQAQGLAEKVRSELQTRQAVAAAEQQAQTSAIAQSLADASTQRQLQQQLQLETEAYQTRLDRLQPLIAEGAIAVDRLFEVEQALRQQQQAAIQNQGELQKSLSEAAQLRSGLEQKQAEGQQSFLEAQQRIQQIQVEIAQRQAKMRETETLLKAAQLKAKQMQLYAPITGTILALKVHNIGEVTQPGQTLAELAPVHAPLVLRAFLPSQEAGLVQTGMAVQVKLDAFPYQNYGVVSGQVVAIAPDAAIDKQLGSGYQVEIALDRHSVTDQRQVIPFKAGQTGNAEIVIRQRRIIDVLLDPIRQLQKSDLKI
jgi:hemolysin D